MRVLLAEGRADAAVTTREIHRAAIPCVVLVADSAAVFTDALHDFSPDVIVSSHTPPQWDVVQSLRTAQSVLPTIPFIVISESLEQETLVDCVRAGAADFVRKHQLARLGPALLGTIGVRHDREENARRETALRSSEERFRLLAEHLPGVVYLRRNDEHYSMLYLNDAVETVTGYSKADFLDNTITFASLCHQEDSPVCDAEIVRAIASRTPFHLVYRLRHRSKGWRWIEEDGIGVYRDGELTFVEGFLTDITERRRTQRRVRRQKDRAQATLASIGEAVITADANGRIKFMNPMAERLTGWPGAEVFGLPLTSLVKTLGNGHGPTENPIVTCLREQRVVGVADEAVLISRNGGELAINGSAAPLRHGNGKPAGAVVVFRDVTQPRALAKQIAYEATHDALTGLINRHEFERRLERAVHSARTDLASHTLCFLDLDQFKQVNDTQGHQAGDALLRELGQALGVRMRTRDTLARVGGDEFAVLLEHCSQWKALRVAADLLRAVHEFRFLWEGRPFSVRASIGVTLISLTCESATAALRDADKACYAAKGRGGNCVHVFDAAQVQPGAPTAPAGNGRVNTSFELAHSPSEGSMSAGATSEYS